MPLLSINLTSLSLIGSIVSLMLTLSIFNFRNNKVPYEGCNYWLISSIINTIGLFLFSFRFKLPNFFTIFIGNLFFIAFYGLFDIGISFFCGKNKPFKKYLILLGIYLISFILFLYIKPNIQARIVVFSFCVSIVLINCIYNIVRHLSKIVRVKYYFTITLLGLMLCWNLFRGIYHLFHGITDHVFLTANTMSTITMLAIIISNVIIIIFMLFTIAERMKNELIAAQQQIKILQGLLPICSRCKRVRNDEGLWKQIEIYIEENSEAFFSHGLCPTCMDELYGKQKWYKKIKEKD